MIGRAALRQVSRYVREPKVYLLERQVGAEAPNDLHLGFVVIRLLFWDQGERAKQFSRAPEEECPLDLRCDPDDGGGFAVETDDATNDVGIAAELRLPGFMAENGNAAGGLIFLGMEKPTELRPNSEDGEQVRGDP
jgi:hypothetical protein